MPQPARLRRLKTRPRPLASKSVRVAFGHRALPSARIIDSCSAARRMAPARVEDEGKVHLV